ncbi:MAG: glycerophosphodiester phosphodiesterase [Gaiellales bacterium]
MPVLTHASDRFRADLGATGVLLVAHRAGNDLEQLRLAEEAGVDLVEADVHLFRRRLHLRHLKTVGPLPLYWDRWEMRRPGTPMLELQELLDAARPDTRLLLDLKGLDPRVPARVAAALEASGREGSVTICSRHWRHLAALRGAPGVRLMHSVGSPSQLRRLGRRLARDQVDGISIHRRLLDRARASDLAASVASLWTWPVNSRREMHRLAGWGVNGVISDHPDLLQEPRPR